MLPVQERADWRSRTHLVSCRQAYCVVASYCRALRSASRYLVRHRSIFLRELTANAAALSRRFSDIHTLAYTPSYDQCVQLASDFLHDLPDDGIAA